MKVPAFLFRGATRMVGDSRTRHRLRPRHRPRYRRHPARGLYSATPGAGAGATAAAGLADLAALTPGDFAAVHRKTGFLWKHGDPEALVDLLRAECDAKPDRPRPIGFRP